MKWVLHCDMAGYFMRMTGIGPACTRDVNKAMRFKTKREAQDHPACSHSLTFFEPVKLDEAEANDG